MNNLQENVFVLNSDKNLFQKTFSTLIIIHLLRELQRFEKSLQSFQYIPIMELFSVNQIYNSR